MPWNGSGTFSVTYNWATEGASPPIAISKLDTQDQDIADGLSNCLTRDGQGKPTADIDWNAKKITNIADSTTRTGVPSSGQVQDSSLIVAGSVAGTNTITASLTPAITSYIAGMVVIFTPAGANTGAATIALNGLVAKTINKVISGASTALVANDLVTATPAVLVYDGTQFRLLNPQTIMSAAQILSLLLTVDGVASGLDADLLDGASSAFFQDASNLNAGTLTDARVAVTNVTQHQGSIAIAATQVTSATFADARIAASNVTQHQASLSIAETQIPDGTVLARVGGNETITGTYSFSTRPKTTSAGGFLSHASATNTGGSVTVSASAASGTPAAGDIWIQYT